MNSLNILSVSNESSFPSYICLRLNFAQHSALIDFADKEKRLIKRFDKPISFNIHQFSRQNDAVSSRDMIS